MKVLRIRIDIEQAGDDLALGGVLLQERHRTDAVVRVKQRFPQVRMIVRVESSDTLFPMLRQGDLDIAIDLLGKAGLPPGSPVVQRLEVERGKAERELLAELRHWKGSAVSRKWKAQLGL